MLSTIQLTGFGGKSRQGLISKQIFNISQANTSVVVPSDVTFAVVKCWGASGGAGGYDTDGSSTYRGDSYGGGFAMATIDVASGETLLATVGAGGSGGSNFSNGSSGGGGGGRTALFRGTTPLIIAGASGGGGGGGSQGTGGYGGAGGGSTGGTGGSGRDGTVVISLQGYGGTQSAGGNGGYTGKVYVDDGGYLNGGSGGYNAGGAPSGGDSYVYTGNDSRGGSGGGGDGYYGGGAGGYNNTDNRDGGGGGGGGGGSNYVTGTNTTSTQGSSTNPGGSTDVDWDGIAGLGKTSGAGARGLMVIYWYAD